MKTTQNSKCAAGNEHRRCVIVGGADISDYGRTGSFLKEDDCLIYCDSGLKHYKGLGERKPYLIVGDWDSYDDPHMDAETITLPVAKDDTDTMFAVHEALARGFTDFLLIGVIGGRFDHSLANAYILTTLENRGCRGLIVDDWSEMQIVAGVPDEKGSALPGRSDNKGMHPDADADTGALPGRADVDDSYSFFSLVALEGPVHGVTIRGAKFDLEEADITPDHQYATSNEVLPGGTAEITVRDGRLLLIKTK